jgi:hypothetical protein
MVRYMAQYVCNDRRMIRANVFPGTRSNRRQEAEEEVV